MVVDGNRLVLMTICGCGMVDVRGKEGSGNK